MMSNPEYQTKLMQAISDGLDEYLQINKIYRWCQWKVSCSAYAKALTGTFKVINPIKTIKNWMWSALIYTRKCFRNFKL